MSNDKLTFSNKTVREWKTKIFVVKDMSFLSKIQFDNQAMSDDDKVTFSGKDLETLNKIVNKHNLTLI